MNDTHITSIHNILNLFSDIDTHQLKTKKFPGNKVYTSGLITFKNRHPLAFTEVQEITAINKAKYRYHYMDKKQRIIFRYDNAHHYQHLPNFPHHKHTTSQIISCTEPSLQDILIEIRTHMLESG